MDENTNTNVEETTEVETTEDETEQTTDTTSDTSKDVDNKSEDKKEEKTFTQEQVNSFLRKEKLKWEKKNNIKSSEAKKLEDMNKKEQEKSELEQLREKVAEFEAEKLHSDLVKVTQSALSEKGISTTFAEFLVSTDAETTKSNVDEFSKTWNKALEKAVNDRLTGKKPKTSSSQNRTNTTEITDEIFEAMTVEEIIKNKEAVEAYMKKKNGKK